MQSSLFTVLAAVKNRYIASWQYLLCNYKFKSPASLLLCFSKTKSFFKLAHQYKEYFITLLALDFLQLVRFSSCFSKIKPQNFLEALLLLFTGRKETLHVLQAVLLPIHPLTFLQGYDTRDLFLSFVNGIRSQYLLDMYFLPAQSVMKKILGSEEMPWTNSVHLQILLVVVSHNCTEIIPEFKPKDGCSHYTHWLLFNNPAT